MEWMVILMVALLVMGGHHGFGGNQDGKASSGAGAPHVHIDDAAASDKEKL